MFRLFFAFSRDIDFVHWIIYVRAYRLIRRRDVPFHGRPRSPARSRRPGGATHGTIDPVITRDQEAERARLAARIDGDLRAICRSEMAVRLELGAAARALIARRGYRSLGFVRLADYARERLGVSARTLELAAWLATRLEALPLVAAAFDRSEITWTQARAIARVASKDQQDAWLARARALTAAELEDLSRSSVGAAGSPVEPDDDDDDEIDGEPVARIRVPCPARLRALWRRALELASRVAGEPLAIWRAAEIVAAEAFSGRPAGASFGDRMLLTVIRLTRRARRLGARADEPSVPGHAGMSPPSPAIDASADALPVAATGDEPPSDHGAAAGDGPPADPTQTGLLGLAAPSVTAPCAPDTRPGPSILHVRPDPFVLDTRLVTAITALRTSEPKIGRLLRLLVDRRLHRVLGCRSLDEYVRERLGFSTRKAWALLRVERRARPIASFAQSYEDGSLSWVRALALLPVITRENAAPWLARATSVTVRRLVDEVNWVLEARDILGANLPLDPPPAESRLVSTVRMLRPADVRAGTPDGMASGDERADAQAHLDPTATCMCRKTALARRLQIGAPAMPGEGRPATACECRKTSLASERRSATPPMPSAAEVCDAEIGVRAPVTVAALFQDTLDAYGRDGEPRWTALERVLRHVIAQWEGLPRHRDPVFARDGWRCTVPGCSSRRNLHDHHVHFRSRGGDNGRENRTTICAAHHLHGVHDGKVRVSGTAPDGLAWDLGVRRDAPPLLRYIGDTLRT